MFEQRGKSLKEWLSIYENKTGDRAELPYGYRLCYLAERGFASMKPDIEGKMMVVYQVCGDGKFWRDYAEMMAAGMGLDCVGTICTRAIEPYIRSFGWEILSKTEINGQRRYRCQDSIGRLIICTYKCDGDKEGMPPHYWVTHYLNKKATESVVMAPTRNKDENKEGEEIVCGI